MTRHKTTIQTLLVAAVLLLAAGTPAQARNVAGRTTQEVTRYEKHQAPTLWRWLVKRLSRYAMAAN